MKKSLLISLSLVTLFFIYIQHPQQSERAPLTEYLNNHPYSQVITDEELKTMPKRDRPDLAMQHNFLMTMDPTTKEVPTDRLVTAFNNLKESQSGRFAADAIPGVSWTELGPDNIGGRTRALMWDPNDVNNQKLWAAGVAGGIWFNTDVTDVNTSWQNVDDFMANLAVTTLAYDPSNTLTFYAGTGEGFFNGDAVRGGGIFKSTDGGTSWDILASTENGNFAFVQKVVVTSDGTILAGTRAVSGTSGLYRSIDGGASFTRMTDVSGSVADIEIAANGDIYVGTLTSGTVYRSVDGGLNWVNVSPSGTASRVELAVAPSASSTTATTVLYVLGEDNANVGYFKKSVDGGDNWSDLTIPKYRSQSCSESSDDFTRGQAWYDLILAVKPTDESVVLAGGINVLKSSDGGSTMAEVSYWTGGCDSYVHADIHAIAFRPDNPDEVVIGSDGGVSYSADAGSSSDPTFNDRNKDYAVTQFYAVAAENSTDSDYFLAGAQDNGTQQFSTANGASTDEVTGGDGAFCFIDQDNNNLQITSYIRNVYYLLNSSGGFVQTLSNDQSSGRFINPADYDNTSDILYSAGGNDELKRISGISSSPGSQETLALSLNGEQISALRADANTANRLFVGTGSGGIYRIDDADQTTPTVTDITSDMSGQGYISSIDIGSSDNVLLVTSSSYGVQSVWYSDDGGTTWVDKDDDASLPDMPVRWGLFNPDNPAEVLLATELGVWSTTDITATNPAWEQTSTNLANVRCDMLQYRASDKKVVVATHGRGLFTADPFAGTDDDPPLISTLDPTDNETEIRLDVNLELAFNEPVNAGTGNIVIQRVTDDSNFETIDVTSGLVTVSGSMVTINPSTDFEPTTEYRVLIDAGAFVDDFSNAFEGILDNDTWTFTTFDGDEPPVQISTIDDIDVLVNASDVLIDLDNYFEDPDGDPISYTITENTNEALLITSITGSELTIEIGSDMIGNGQLSIEATSNSKSVSTSFLVNVNAPTLYSQNGASVGGVPSQRFPDFGNSELEAADNFTVTAASGSSWYIQAVSVVGSNNGESPVEAMFRIYADDAGLPGDLVYESDVLPINTTTDDTDFQLILDEPLEITAGDYWLAVLDVQEFGSAQSQWFWSYYDGSVDDYARRDQDDLLAGSWSTDWALSGDFRDMIFALQGYEALVAPSDLVLTESAGMATLDWQDNTDAETNYIVERAIGESGSFEVVATLDPNTVTFSESIPATNETLQYKVYAVDGGGNSSGAASSSLLSIPSIPVLSATSDATSMQFTINWSTTDNATDFVLDVSESDDFSSFLTGFENLSVAGFSSTVGNRLSGTYFFRVAASNASGISEFSEAGTIVLDPLGLSNEENINVYPNPGNGIYYFQGVDVNEVIKVFDVSGKHIRTVSGGDGKIDIQDQEDGIYVITIGGGSESISKTIIKQ